MALMFVTPHDLEGACRECGTTIAKLSEDTGIPVRELHEFAAGRLPLKASDRFAILETLSDTAPPRRWGRSGTDSIVPYYSLLMEVKEEESEPD